MPEAIKNTDTYDVIIIGGGINGAGIARELALRNYTVLLLEKNDFASGTSSASSKLVHGGIRYLENGDFHLVKEALRERHYLLKNAPDLVKPLPFIFPVYQTNKRPPWMIRCGVWLYDLLAGKHLIQKSCWLSPKEALKKEPTLKKEGLLGASLYWDAQMDDTQVCLANIEDAKNLGATVLNHTEVTQINAPYVITKKKTYHAKMIINATGPWTDEILQSHHRLLRPSKGIHIITKKLTSSHAIVVTNHIDNRIFFVIPWKDNTTLIGTTDTDYPNLMKDLTIEPSEIDYLLDEINQQFPTLNLTQKDVISSFVGVRPLLDNQKRKGFHIGTVSREHAIIQHTPNFMSIIGGKFTTYRAIAEEVAKKTHHLLNPQIPFKKGLTITRRLPSTKTPL
jgi:glycerol-3-phosphate dehydrogenase